MCAPPVVLLLRSTGTYSPANDIWRSIRYTKQPWPTLSLVASLDSREGDPQAAWMQAALAGMQESSTVGVDAAALSSSGEPSS